MTISSMKASKIFAKFLGGVLGFCFFSAFAQASPLNATIDQILKEHEQLTGEILRVTVIQSPSEMDTKKTGKDETIVVDFSKNKTITVNLFWNPKKQRFQDAQTQAGYGFQALISQKAWDLFSKQTLKEIHSRNLDDGLAITTLYLLRKLNSPLIENGFAKNLLIGAGYDPARIEAQTEGTLRSSIWILFCIACLLISTWVLDVRFSPEVHYTSAGKTHFNAFTLRLRPVLSLVRRLRST